jgi:hypothetical protein
MQDLHGFVPSFRMPAVSYMSLWFCVLKLTSFHSPLLPSRLRVLFFFFFFFFSTAALPQIFNDSDLRRTTTITSAVPNWRLHIFLRLHSSRPRRALTTSITANNEQLGIHVACWCWRCPSTVLTCIRCQHSCGAAPSPPPPASAPASLPSRRS